jgi:coenzyme PQQ precursor peptide PqqA
MTQVNTHSVFIKHDTNMAHTAYEKKLAETTPSSVPQTTAVWESPTVETFDLCMEVTAYFQQGQ